MRFSFSYLLVAMDDSSEDLFITQTALEYKMLEQDDDYDCSYLNSQHEANWSVPLGDVEYWDFSDQKDNSSVAPSLPISNEYTKKPSFDSLVSEEYFADDENVSKIVIFRMLVVALHLVSFRLTDFVSFVQCRFVSIFRILLLML